MEVLTIVGSIIVGIAVILITFLVLISNRTIKRIEKNGHNSLREILKERGGGRGGR